MTGNDINNVEQELDIMQLDYNTPVHQGQARLEDYYAHVITLLTEHSAHEQVMTVARLFVLDLLKVKGFVHCTRLFSALGRSTKKLILGEISCADHSRTLMSKYPRPNFAFL